MFLPKSGDWKTLLFILFIAFTYSKCASIQYIKDSTAARIGIVKPKESKEDKETRFRKDVTIFAKDYVGTKYKYAGRSPRTGFDCSGFTMYVLDHFGMKLSSSSSAQEAQGKKIEVKNTKPGDLIFFRRSKKGRVFHVAMVVSNDKDGLKVVHSTSRGVVVDNLYASKYWKPKISTARDVISTQEIRSIRSSRK